ncbi:MAG: dTDP-4-amino-4,6-dideoxygalactose transaminase [Candidatus Latescibacteria bacterium]|jgi:dTDP-4-amino-4,6-dideoxygalactose transaminase|nr:dTDP-4-amino-4,6-dideoxygalactose transaminase [Candidatus Latescibacterota bacterium]
MNELDYVTTVLESGRLAGDGVFCARAESLLGELTGAHSALVTSSCTHALEMCAMLLDAPSGSEIIVPDFTFPSTANAFAMLGYRPVFADIDPATLNISPESARSCVSSRTVAIVVMHYGGVACDMEAFRSLCDDHDLILIEDNAHGLGGTWNDAPLGTFGNLATQSFHETKNISCGEGGALLINDDSYKDRAEILREKGTNRSLFRRGLADKYTWVDTGSSYVLSEVSAAILLAQLEDFLLIQANRRHAWSTYRNRLEQWGLQRGVRFQSVPEYVSSACHAFPLLFPSPHDRDRFIDHLDRHGITAVFHYQPLHASRMGRLTGANREDCSVSTSVAECLVRLPLYSGIQCDEVERVVEATIASETPIRRG